MPKLPKLNQYLKNISNLEDILNALSEMVQVIDAQTKQVEYSTRSLLDLLEYSPAQIEALGQEWPIRIIHPDEYQFLVNHIENFPKLKVGEQSRIVYRAKDAHDHWRQIESLNTVISADSEGKALKVAGITREFLPISSRGKVAEVSTEHRCKNCQKLLGVEIPDAAVLEIKCHRCGEFNQILRSDLQQLFFSTHSKVYVTDDQATILYVNDAVLQLSGYTPEEVIGKKPSIWGKQMPTEYYKNMYRQIKAEKRSISQQMTNRTKNGQLYLASVQISPILDSRGEVKYFVGIESIIQNPPEKEPKPVN